MTLKMAPLNNRLFLVGLAGTLLLFASHGTQAAEWEVKFWVSAFIPNKHPMLPDYIRKTELGTWVVSAPKPPKLLDLGGLSGSCFVTDNRGFEANPTASSRVTTELKLTIKNRELVVDSVNGRNKVRIGETHNVDCVSGKDIRPPQKESANSVAIGDVKTNGFTKVFFVRASSSNPFYKLLGLTISPSIDYSYTVTYDYLRHTINIKGTVGYFPAFEAYYSINGGKTQPIMKLSPYQDSTASSLVDFNLGVNTRNFEHTIKLDGS